MKIFLKIILGIIVVILIAAAGFGFALSRWDIFGWRLNIKLQKVEMNVYQGLAPDITFQYPKIFEIDADNDKKYGKTYITGFKLKTDNRTGCDLRKGGPELDFSQSESELEKSTTGVIQTKASDFKMLSRQKSKIGGRDAFSVSFSFLDPIGARVRLDQIFTSNKEGSMMIICGTGEYQYALFERDFNSFFQSINFEGKIGNKGEKWYQAWYQKAQFWKK